MRQDSRIREDGTVPSFIRDREENEACPSIEESIPLEHGNIRSQSREGQQAPSEWTRCAGIPRVEQCRDVRRTRGEHIGHGGQRAFQRGVSFAAAMQLADAGESGLDAAVHRGQK